MLKKTVAVIGGDKRQAYVAEMLAQRGYTVVTCGLPIFEEDGEIKALDCLSDIKRSDIVVLPAPAMSDNEYINAPLAAKPIRASELLQNMNRGTYLLGGKISVELEKTAGEYGVIVTDYLLDEQLAVKNAVPTAEGAIEIAIREKDVTLFESNVAVVGFGRVARALASRLKALGATVTVFARNPKDRAFANIEGCCAYHTSEMKNKLWNMDTVFNTVPQKIIDKTILSSLNKECLLIDLASKPGGVDFTAAKDMGINTVWALALPGKTAPVSAAKILVETLIPIMEGEAI